MRPSFSSGLPVILAAILIVSAMIDLTGIARGDIMIAAQTALHAGLFIGLAGGALSFRFSGRIITVMIAGGVLCLLCLMGEDVSGLITDNPAWRKDLTDLCQRLCLIVFLFSRLGLLDPQQKNRNSRIPALR